MNGLKDAKKIVFKVGTSSLTYATGKTNLRRMALLVRVLADLSNAGKDIVLVSSGAIGVGVGKLGLAEKPSDIPSRQAAACIGQCELMFTYDKFFSEYGKITGQLLITKSDVENDERRANLINAFDKMLQFGVIPIINENDSVAVEEIAYGDNDNLSATVAKLIDADALVILTDTDGLFTANPQTDETAMLIPVVNEITPEIEALAGGRGSTRGTGGMITKLHAAKAATAAGISTVIMNGSAPEDIYKLFDGHSVGTFFKAKV
ncbi:MAG: glutamate 5-kinase [Clostridia bacterium]|nr:glutamate 5-kinase [Clostridia bacterium]